MLREIFLITLISINANASFFSIEETILTEDPIHLRFSNLIPNEWYKLNWTANYDGVSFSYFPDPTGYYELTIRLNNPTNALAFDFKLYFVNGTEETWLDSRTVFWSEVEPNGGGFQFEFPDILGILMSIPLWGYALIPITIIFWLIFSYIFRRGR